MNSIVNLFSNFKEFYSEINGATLTGAIDVVVVEQPDGSYQSSPFHVRFGKLGVLRSREKVVDIELNGESVELQMKLGESGEAFFVEECDDDDSEVPAHMATSPIPSHSYLSNYEGDGGSGAGPSSKGATGSESVGGSVGPVQHDEGSVMVMMPLGGPATNDVPSVVVGGLVDTEESMPRPRRNSVDLSNEMADLERAKYENQRSEYLTRRHTDNVTNRPDLSLTKKEYTMQKLRQEWEAATEAEQEQIFHMEGLDDEAPPADWQNSTLLPSHSSGEAGSGDVPSKVGEEKQFKPIDAQPTTGASGGTQEMPSTVAGSELMSDLATADSVLDSKSKKKRRKKSILKKKNAQRKGSTSSSSGGGSNHSDQNDAAETDSVTTASQATVSTGSSGSTNVAHSGIDAKDDDTGSSSVAVKEDSESLKTNVMVLATPHHHSELDIHFFSDTDIGNGTSPQQSRPSTPIQSDTEFEISQREKPETEDERLLYDSWKWGELPTKPESKVGDLEGGGVASKQAQHNSMLNGLMSFMKYNNKKKRQSVPEGLYLSDLDKLREPEIAQLYFPPLSMLKQQQQQQQRGGSADEEDRESGNGTSIPHSPTSMEEGPGGFKGLDSDCDEHHNTELQRNRAEGVHYAGGDGDQRAVESIALSLCGGLDNADGPSNESFERHRLQYSNVLADPAVFGDPELVVRINGKYYSWAAACPQVMTLLAFQKSLPTELLDGKKVSSTDPGLTKPDDGTETDPSDANKLQQIPQAQQPTQQNAAGGRWWYWGRSNESKPPPATDSSHLPLTPTTPTGADGNLKPSTAVATQTTRSNSLDDSNEGDPSAAMAAATVGDNAVPVREGVGKTVDGYNGSLSSDDSELAMDKTQPVAIVPGVAPDGSVDNSMDKLLFLGGEKYRKTLRLSTERIKALNLLDGMNEVVFSVTTAYQGTTRCKCYLFKWKHSDKVVISDIDGTITRSDVLGHILPMVGKSWDQIGVAALFSKIEENGYKMLYLSARAIGQAKTTRGYLQSIRQGDVKLPDGPLLLNPTSLMSAFHREVIEKKPEQFKIACLNDIRELFPEKNPFYAGYGNRINDVWAYRAVGIPTSRIFTINPKGELKHDLTQTFQSTYTGQSLVVNDYFPPIVRPSPESDYSDYDEDEDDFDEQLVFNFEASGDDQQHLKRQKQQQHQPVMRSLNSDFAEYRSLQG